VLKQKLPKFEAIEKAESGADLQIAAPTQKRGLTGAKKVVKAKRTKSTPKKKARKL
jgi:hypothetical protein